MYTQTTHERLFLHLLHKLNYQLIFSCPAGSLHVMCYFVARITSVESSALCFPPRWRYPYSRQNRPPALKTQLAPAVRYILTGDPRGDAASATHRGTPTHSDSSPNANIFPLRCDTNMDLRESTSYFLIESSCKLADTEWK